MPATLRESAAGEYGAVRLVAATIPFGSSTVDLETLAVGDVVIRCWAQVVTAFNAGTTNVLTVGDGTTANKYLAAGNITPATPAVYPTGGLGPFAAETAAGTLRVTYAQTGTAATTGSARVYAQVTDAAV
jgi:hypothetical protein